MTPERWQWSRDHKRWTRAIDGVLWAVRREGLCYVRGVGVAGDDNFVWQLERHYPALEQAMDVGVG